MARDEERQDLVSEFAAAAYLAAAEGATGSRGLELRADAAAKLLESGHIAEGMPIFRDVLASAGLQILSSPARALLPIGLSRVRLFIRGLDYVERSAEQVPPLELARLDVAWHGFTAMSMLDPFSAAEFSTRFLIGALNAGEPTRSARALAVEYALLGALGKRDTPRALAMIEKAEEMARRLADPLASGMVQLQRGIIEAIRDGRIRQSLQSLLQAERMFDAPFKGATLFRDVASYMANGSLWWMGRWREMKERFSRGVADARERGDFWVIANGHTTGMWTFIMDDDPASARVAVKRPSSRSARNASS